MLSAAPLREAPERTEQDELIEILASGGWVLDGLGPRFVRAVTDRAARRLKEAGAAVPSDLSSWPTYRIAFLAYNPGVSLSPPRRGATPELLVSTEEPEEVRFWQALIDRIDPRSAYRPATEADRAVIAEGLERLASVAPGSHRNFLDWVSAICPAEGHFFMGASQPHAFGCVSFGRRFFEQRGDALPISLVHELGHQELFLLNLADRLITVVGDRRSRYAPFQGRPRPAIGRLHSAHALFRMIGYQRAAGQRATQNRLLLEGTLATFEEGSLTPFGRRLVEEVYRPALCA